MVLGGRAVFCVHLPLIFMTFCCSILCVLIQETVWPGHTGVIHKNVFVSKNTRRTEELVGGLAINWQNAVIQVYSLILLLLTGSQHVPCCDLEAFPEGVGGLKEGCD